MFIEIKKPTEIEQPDGTQVMATLPRSRPVRGSSQLEGYHAVVLNAIVSAASMGVERAERQRLINNSAWNSRMGELNRGDVVLYSDDRPLLEEVHRLEMAQSGKAPFQLRHGYILPASCAPCDILSMPSAAGA
jgi:hypothetical protein